MCLLHHGSPAISPGALLDTNTNYNPETQHRLAATEDMSRWEREKMTEDTEIDGWRKRGKMREWWSDWNASQRNSLSHCLTVMRAPTEGVHKLTNSQTHTHTHSRLFLPPHPKRTACESTPCWRTKGRNGKKKKKTVRTMSLRRLPTTTEIEKKKCFNAS